MVERDMIFKGYPIQVFSIEPDTCNCSIQRSYNNGCENKLQLLQ
jgi:hypothetical protein